MTREALVEFQEVEKRYGEVRALDGLSFGVPSSGCLGLLGPNGAGKTTALKSLLGLTRIDGGAITSRARRIGYLPQQPGLFGWMTGREYLEFVGAAVGMPSGELKEAVPRWLRQVGLEGAGRRRVGGFSGGMRQRLGLAAALLHEPDLVVLDEPVSSLDPVGRHEVLNLIGEIKRERCVIMSTHILDDAERVCDEVVIMRDGRALLQRTMPELRREVPARYEVELAGTDGELERVQAVFSEQPWVQGSWVEGPTLVLALTGDEEAPEAMRTLASLPRVSVLRFAKSKASLEDVFLRVVNGR
ncbi:ABC transporter ATP-binding protein [Limnochorda pilosa]|uniref:ABC transporter ATP-binding protein n=1 Tax=Limnochorda pilosa TaxID=1555112 RepID=A0A0K2SHX7_LIMPI|nr:ABC transporter ATP-binding protein [Limnochorda pilosa]BAS26721.1 ABC transporter ATP-binding protein [Limnochorda pilosa]